MHLVEVDHVGAQPPQRALDRPADVVARAARHIRAVVHRHAELRREHDAVAPALEHLADVRLARALGVDVRRVEERDALLERGIDHGARLLEVAAPAEVVRAEADDRDLRAPVAQLTRAHVPDATRRRETVRPRVHDDERLRRPRERDVELAQPLLAVLGDRGGLDDDDVVELEPLRLARRQDRHGHLVVRVAARRGSASERGAITAISPSSSASAAASRSAACITSSSATRTSRGGAPPCR